LTPIGILQQRAVSHEEVLTEQTADGVAKPARDRAGQGAVEQVRNVDVDVAFDMIGAYARRADSRLSDVARLVVTDLASLPDLAEAELH
jgi:hypothetical protein